eukprot:1239798-Pyramimonas_sp.AAC.1
MDMLRQRQPNGEAQRRNQQRPLLRRGERTRLRHSPCARAHVDAQCHGRAGDRLCAPLRQPL